MVHIFIGQWKMLYVGDMILVPILVLEGRRSVPTPLGSGPKISWMSYNTTQF